MTLEERLDNLNVRSAQLAAADHLGAQLPHMARLTVRLIGTPFLISAHGENRGSSPLGSAKEINWLGKNPSLNGFDFPRTPANGVLAIHALAKPLAHNAFGPFAQNPRPKNRQPTFAI